MPRGRKKKTRGTGKGVLVRSAEFVGWALGGLEREIDATRERLASLTEQASRLRRRLGTSGASTQPSSASGGPTRRRRRRRMSPEARRRISEMMKKRWAERKRKASK